jgi:hypothetical protein
MDMALFHLGLDLSVSHTLPRLLLLTPFMNCAALAPAAVGAGVVAAAAAARCPPPPKTTPTGYARLNTHAVVK